MKILPILLVNNSVEELPIIIFDCEKIVLEQLVCTFSDPVEIPECRIYFNGTALQYLPVIREKKRTVFYLDGLKNNCKSFNIHSPCNLKFMLKLTNVPSKNGQSANFRFFLHLSLELKNSKLRTTPAVDI